MELKVDGRKVVVKDKLPVSILKKFGVGRFFDLSKGLQKATEGIESEVEVFKNLGGDLVDEIVEFSLKIGKNMVLTPEKFEVDSLSMTGCFSLGFQLMALVNKQPKKKDR